MKWLVFEKSSWKQVSQKTVPTTTADGDEDGTFFPWSATEGSINVKQRMNIMVNQDILKVTIRLCIFIWENALSFDY